MTGAYIGTSAVVLFNWVNYSCTHHTRNSVRTHAYTRASAVTNTSTLTHARASHTIGTHATRTDKSLDGPTLPSATSGLTRQRRWAGALLVAVAAAPDPCRVQAQGGMLFSRGGTATCLQGTRISNVTAVSVA